MRPKLPSAVRFEPREIRKGNMFCAVTRDDFEAVEQEPYLDVFEKIWGAIFACFFGGPDGWFAQAARPTSTTGSTA